jgi:hemolysin III
MDFEIVDKKKSVSDTDQDQWYLEWKQRPTLRGWLHVVAAPVTIAATSYLAARRQQYRSSLVAYAAGLSSMFLTSASYHRLTRNKKQFRYAQAADHAMIFGAIAGTATPVISSVLPPEKVKPIVLAVWGGAALGAAGKIVDLQKGTSFTNLFYVVYGWSALSLLPSIITKKGLNNALLLIGGGAFYTLGAILFSTHKLDFNPRVFGYHETWHVATVAGAALHMVAVSNMTQNEK